MEMTIEKAISYLENMRWLKGYDNTTVDSKPLREIIDDIIALLKAYELRVMTWDEVRATLKAPVWKETKSTHNALYQGWVLAYDIQTGQGITGTRLGMAEPSGRVVWYKADDYGKTWRCWTSKPSLKQMEETPWT